jgi:hypothetical protein
MGEEGFWLHIWAGSRSDCLDGKGEILAVHGKEEILAAYTEREGFWLYTREGRDSGCIHGKGGVLDVHGKGGNLAAGTEREGSGCCHGKWVS